MESDGTRAAGTAVMLGALLATSLILAGTAGITPITGLRPAVTDAPNTYGIVDVPIGLSELVAAVDRKGAVPDSRADADDASSRGTQIAFGPFQPGDTADLAGQPRRGRVTSDTKRADGRAAPADRQPTPRDESPQPRDDNARGGGTIPDASSGGGSQPTTPKPDHRSKPGRGDGYRPDRNTASPSRGQSQHHSAQGKDRASSGTHGFAAREQHRAARTDKAARPDTKRERVAAPRGYAKPRTESSRPADVKRSVKH